MSWRSTPCCLWTSMIFDIANHELKATGRHQISWHTSGRWHGNRKKKTSSHSMKLTKDLFLHFFGGKPFFGGIFASVIVSYHFENRKVQLEYRVFMLLRWKFLSVVELKMPQQRESKSFVGKLNFLKSLIVWQLLAPCWIDFSDV